MPSNLKILQNLDRLQKIVNELGAPSDYFIRFIQDRGGALTDLDAIITLLQAEVTALESDVTDIQDVDIIAGTALSGGGNISGPGDVTIDHDDTAVTPGSYTSADITVDAQGHITSAANGSGGGGGSFSYEKTAIVPVSSDFTFLNQGSATTTDVTGKGLLLSAPGNGGVSDQNRLLFSNTVPSFSSFEMTLRGRPTLISGNSSTEALFARDSGSGKFIIFSTYNMDSNLIQAWSGFSAFASNLYFVGRSAITNNWFWKRIRVSGGTIFFDFSADGIIWTNLYSESVAGGYLGTIDQIGVGCTAQATNGGTSIFNSFEIV